MPSNNQRREAAKRKLERQLARRQALARQRKQRMTIVGVVAAVVVVALGIWIVQANTGDDNTASPAAQETPDDFATDTAQLTETAQVTDTAEAPLTACSYPTDGTSTAATAPTNLDPAVTGTVDAALKLSAGAVTMQLDRASAPCAVNSLVSLASQGYFDGTTCHRLTTSDALKVLQCGDPTGTGSGGPGYSFADENLDKIDPTNGYGEGVIAMANAGADTNGSQFFLVYGDSQLPPNYTVLGTMDAAGLQVVKDIAAKGTDGGGTDGAPKEAVTITSLTVPADAVTATAPAAESSAPVESSEAGSGSDEPETTGEAESSQAPESTETAAASSQEQTEAATSGAPETAATSATPEESSAATLTSTTASAG